MPKDSAVPKDTVSKDDAARSKDAAPPKDTVPLKDAAQSKGAAPSKDTVLSKDTGLMTGTALMTGPVLSRPPGSSPAEVTTRWMLLLLTGLAGAAVGAIGSFGHRATETWLGVGWPSGLALCFGGLIGLLLGVGELLVAGVPDSWRPTRLPALGWASAGWLLALLWITYLGPPPSFARKGDVVLANDGKSLAYLLGGMLLVTIAVYRAWVATLAARLGSRPGAPGSGHSKG